MILLLYHTVVLYQCTLRSLYYVVSSFSYKLLVSDSVFLWNISFGRIYTKIKVDWDLLCTYCNLCTSTVLRSTLISVCSTDYTVDYTSTFFLAISITRIDSTQ